MKQLNSKIYKLNKIETKKGIHTCSNTLVYLMPLESNKPENLKFSDKPHLIYMTAFGEKYRAMASVLYNSLRTNGCYKDEIIIFSDGHKGLEYLYSDEKCHVIIPDLKILKGINPTNYRVFLSQYIHAPLYDQIMYLDCDIICFNNIEPMFDAFGYFRRDEEINLNRGCPGVCTECMTENEKILYNNHRCNNSGTWTIDSALYNTFIDKWKECMKVKPLSKHGLEQAGFNALIKRNIIKNRPFKNTHIQITGSFKPNNINNYILLHCCGSGQRKEDIILDNNKYIKNIQLNDVKSLFINFNKPNKTIINVYTLNGIGDYLKGSIQLFELFNKFVKVKLNISQHVISNFIKQNNELFDYAEIDDSKIKFKNLGWFTPQIQQEFVKVLNDFLNNNEEILYISTNFSTDQFKKYIDNDIKCKLMPFFNFTDDIITETEKLIDKYNEYEIFDVRMDDSYLFDTIIPKNIEKSLLKSIEQKNFNKNTIVISNNNYIKNKICEKYNLQNLKINNFNSSVYKLDKNKDASTYFYNVIKLNLLKNSKKIYSYSDYIEKWDCGFNLYVSLIFNIPREFIYKSIIENVPKNVFFNKCYQFGRMTANIFNNSNSVIKLLENGKTEYHYHSNETYWDIIDGYLCFLNNKKQITTKFDNEKNGILFGKFIDPKQNINHYLKEIPEVKPWSRK